MNLSLPGRISLRAFATIAATALLGAACSRVVEDPPGPPPPPRGTPTTFPVSSMGSGAAPAPVVRYQPVPSDPQSWPDACQMLSQQQLATILSGTATQTGTYGRLRLPNVPTRHYMRCEYSGQDSGGNPLAVIVNVDTVAPSDQAQYRFTTDKGSTASPTAEPIGDEAFFYTAFTGGTASGIEVRQGVTVWSVLVADTKEDRATRQSQAEQLARMIAPELS